MKIVRREIGEGDKDIRVDLSSMAFSCVATDSGCCDAPVWMLYT